jgi:hypothetical protein
MYETIAVDNGREVYGARHDRGKEAGDFSGFQGIQRGMFITLYN